MLKKEFERRHGSISYHDATAGGNGYVKLPQKHNLLDEDQPAAIWYIAQNMPFEKFSVLKVEPLRIIFEHMTEIKEKEVRDYYLGLIARQYLNTPYGWFARGGRGLYSSSRELSDLHDSEKKVALTVLRILKREFMKYHYRDSNFNIHHINSMIRDLGGAQDTVKSFETAKAELINKVPRKQKKEQKKQGLWATLIRSR